MSIVRLTVTVKFCYITKMSGTTASGFATSVVLTLTPAEEKKIDRKHLLMALMKLVKALHGSAKTHPVFLALRNAGIDHFNQDFVHLTTACVEQLQHEKTQANLVTLEMNCKIQVWAPLAFSIPRAISQEWWKHWHHREHAVPAQGLLKQPLQSHTKNYSMGFDCVHKWRSCKLEQGGQAQCTRFQTFSRKQQLGWLRGLFLSHFGSP